MFSSKSEKVLLVLLVFVIYWILAFFTRILRIEITNGNRIIIICLHLFILLMVETIYLKIRNRNFLRKVYDLAARDQYKEALSLFDDMILKHPKLSWLKAEKAIILVFSGQITLFLSFRNTIAYPHKYYKISSYYRLAVMNYTIDFLFGPKTCVIDSACLNNKNWGKYVCGYYNDLYKSISCYQKGDFSGAINYADNLLSFNSRFLKLVSFIVLIRSYKIIGNEELQGKYQTMLEQTVSLEKYRENITV